MKHFDQDFLQFFKDLEKNNQKEWFHENKKRYEKSVKNPFTAFVKELISQAQALDSSYELEAKNAVGRINRDIRFSKDKTPYNTHYTAYLSPMGKKDKGLPGIYIRCSHEGVWAMAGVYGLEKEHLTNLRESIADDPEKFKSLIENKEFASVFGTLQGEQNKRISDKYLQEAAAKEPIILNKQFYFVKENPAKLMLDPKLTDKIMEWWKIAKPVNDYLIKGARG